MSVLEARGVGVSFGGLPAVDGLDLTIRSGAITGLVGPNGAGKSTALNLISGYYPLDGGTVVMRNGDGETDLSGRSVHERARAGLGRTFQTPRLIPEMTAAENVALGRAWHGQLRAWAAVLPLPYVRRSQRSRLVEAGAVLERFGLGSAGGLLPSELSLGAQRVVELARAAFAGSDLLLLDEPFAGLAATERQHLGGELRRVVAEGAGILLVEHNLEMIRSLADDVLVVDQGREIAFGTPDQALADPRVEEVYLGSGTLAGLDLGGVER